MRKEQWIALAGLGATIAYAVYMLLQLEAQQLPAPDQLSQVIQSSRFITPVNLLELA